MEEKMLYTPIQLRNLSLSNRWVMSPMCMFSSDDGMPNEFHMVHYGSRAMGGLGLIVLEATAVEANGRITPKCMGIWNAEQADKLAEIVNFVHQYSDSKIGIQLSHAGRKASTWKGVQLDLNEGWQTIAPSGIPYKTEERTPHEMSIGEIREMVVFFKSAASRALEAGFDLIEIHAAHGYLIHQFLSPISNIRTDQYGGNLENRARFLLEIVDAINELLNDNHPLFVRISADEYAENGWDLEQSVQLAHMLKDRNVDLIDVSSGGNIDNAKISVFDNYQVPFSSKIKNEAKIKTGAVGLITNADQAEKILTSHDADLIFVGRELLRNPYLATLEAFDREEKIFFPPQYARAKQ